MGRKRKRSQRDDDTDDYVEPLTIAEESDDNLEPPADSPRLMLDDSIGEENGEEDTGRPVTKELEIWESFKEEFHETFEMLPLYLHRTFALLRELDQQATRHYGDLLPNLMSYVQLRKSLAGQEATAADAFDTSQAEAHVNGETSEPSSGERLGSSSRATSIPESPDSLHHPNPASTRQLLAHIGRLSEEALHATEEKTSLAQSAHDTVDRHIRLLDQAIREQETALTVGLRQGTHPSLLPDLVVPRWARPRVVHSPIPGFDDSDDGDAAPAPPVPVSAPKRGKAARSHKRKAAEPAKEQEKTATPAPVTVRRVRLKVPPMAAVLSGDTPVDPNEPRYCYCNGVSYGDMVGCDGDNCEHEWFHLGCVGLTELPASTTWFCRDCQAKLEKTPAPTRRRR